MGTKQRFFVFATVALFIVIESPWIIISLNRKITKSQNY